MIVRQDVLKQGPYDSEPRSGSRSGYKTHPGLKVLVAGPDQTLDKFLLVLLEHSPDIYLDKIQERLGEQHHDILTVCVNFMSFR